MTSASPLVAARQEPRAERQPGDPNRSEISIRKAKGNLRVKDLSRFKTFRSVLKDVCPVLLESIASAEKFDTHNEVDNVKEHECNGTTKSQDQPQNTRLNAIPRTKRSKPGRIWWMTSRPKGCIEVEELQSWLAPQSRPHLRYCTSCPRLSTKVSYARKLTPYRAIYSHLRIARVALQR
jgi:hypothetical protein